MRRVNILLGGPKSEYPEELLENPSSIPGPWIGADRGNVYLISKGITPKMAIGDFDSSDSKEKAEIKAAISEVKKYPPEKDDTDAQLTILAAHQKYPAEEYCIYGATGGRIDHFLANLYLSYDPRFADFYEKMYYKSATNTIRFYKPGEYRITHENGMKYVAFVHLGPVKNLNIKDAKYTLRNYTADHAVSWASNEFVKPTIDFNFESGVIAVIQSKDKASK